MEPKLKYPKGFIGPSYASRNALFDCQRTINMYVELDQSEIEGIPGTGNNQEMLTLMSFPGLSLITSVGTGSIRGIYTDSTGKTLWFVVGNQLYAIQNTITSTPILIGTLNVGSTNFVSMADNGTSLFLVDGLYGYYTPIVIPTVPVLTVVNDPNFYPADFVCFQDGYFVFNKTGTAYFFTSQLYSTTMQTLNEENKSGYADTIKAIIINNRELFLLGTKTLEIWWDSGASQYAPFSREDGKFAEIGCVAAGSVQKINNTFIFLGTDSSGGTKVYMMMNDMPNPVSTPAVEYALSKSTDLSSATAYTWHNENHYFYAITAPGMDTTLVFDTFTELWVDQQSNINGTVGRHIAQWHAYFNGKHIIGDYSTNNLYYYDFNNYTDNGNPLIRTRISPVITNNMMRTFYQTLQLIVNTGTGSGQLQNYYKNSTQNMQNPRVFLQMSKDGGYTYSQPISANLGSMGNYQRVRWLRLGMADMAVFKISCADPVYFNIVSAALQMQAGNS